MSALGEILGGTHEFTHRGRVYSVSLIGDTEKLKFERRLYRRARDLAELDRDEMAPGEHEARLKEINDDYVAGRFALEGEVGLKALKNVWGMVTLCAMCFGITEDEMAVILKDRGKEVGALFTVIFHESFPHLVEGAAGASNQG